MLMTKKTAEKAISKIRITDKNIEENIMLSFKPRKINDNLYLYEAFKDDSLIGSCEIKLDNQYADIISVTAFKDDLLIKDGLIRSALKFGADNGAFIARAYLKDTDSKLLLKMGFENIDGILQNDIPSALHGDCKSFA